jgi:adenylosuccinate lyase
MTKADEDAIREIELRFNAAWGRHDPDGMVESLVDDTQLDRLLVHPEAMQKNLDRLGGLVHSQRVLIALTQKGVAREDAYAIVQRNAMRVWRGEGDFLSLLKADADVRKHLSEAELAANFDLGYHLKHVDAIFQRVFQQAP